MKRLYLVATLIAALCIWTGFVDTVHHREAAQRVQQQYISRIDTLMNAVNALDNAVTHLTPDTVSQLRVMQAFVGARHAFKRVEFMIGYAEAEAAIYLNAAPLDRISDDKGRALIPPRGFQVMEEIIYSDGPEAMIEQKEKLSTLIAHARQTLRVIRLNASGFVPSDRQVFEAVRIQLVRTMALGITGFDTPASGNAIVETESAIEGVRDAMLPYLPAIADHSPELRHDIEQNFAQALAYLKQHEDFDSFDRLTFIREYADRLYGLLLRAHLALGIETFRQSVPFNEALQYESASLFDRTPLNPYFYSSDARDAANRAQAELGRTLFFDPVLSGNNTRACASCHQPERAFTDGMAKSAAIHGGTVQRNAPTIINAALQMSQFDDGRAVYLEDQIEKVLHNALEMESSFDQVLQKLQASPEYVEQFRQAFRTTPDSSVSALNLRRAIASYIRSQTSFNSPFDRYMRGELKNIGADVQRGFNLFMGRAACGTCHFAPTFNGTVPPAYTDTEFEVLGTTLTSDFDHPELDPDIGRMAVHGDEIHRHGFKTPTVRNAALTAPYMHNGGFPTLEDVVEFYNRGGGAGLGLDVPNQTLPSDQLNLSDGDKHDLVAFLHSLTDTTGMTTRPVRLPSFPNKPEWNERKIAGSY